MHKKGYPILWAYPVSRLLVIAAPFTSRYESAKNAVRIELLTEYPPTKQKAAIHRLSNKLRLSARLGRNSTDGIRCQFDHCIVVLSKKRLLMRCDLRNAIVLFPRYTEKRTHRGAAENSEGPYSATQPEGATAHPPMSRE